MDADKIISLSPSKLNLFQECALCFWFKEIKGIHRPEGIFPSLPGGMDGVIKKYFDIYREKGELPPELRKDLNGKLLPDKALMTKWRNWRTGLKYEDRDYNAILYGALDDCLIDPSGAYVPLDYKTRGYDLKEDSHEFYQTQLDCYTLMLGANGFEHKSLAYLIYYIPESVRENGEVKFKVQVKEVKTDPQRALDVLHQAVELLRGPQPQLHTTCKYCSWGNDFGNFPDA